MLLAIKDGSFKFLMLFVPSLESFLFKTCNLSNFLISPNAKGSKSLDLFSSSMISTSQFRKFSEVSMCFKIFILFSPSTKTFTVPSGNFKSCKTLLKHPY